MHMVESQLLINSNYVQPLVDLALAYHIKHCQVRAVKIGVELLLTGGALLKINIEAGNLA